LRWKQIWKDCLNKPTNNQFTKICLSLWSFYNEINIVGIPEICAWYRFCPKCYLFIFDWLADGTDMNCNLRKFFVTFRKSHSCPQSLNISSDLFGKVKQCKSIIIVKQYVNQIIYWLRIFLVTGFHFLQSNDMHILFHVQNTYIYSDCRFRIKYLSSLIISFERSLSNKIEWQTCMRW